MMKEFELNISMLEEMLNVCNDKYENSEYSDIAESYNKEKILIRLIECMLMFNEDIYNEIIEDKIERIIEND